MAKEKELRVTLLILQLLISASALGAGYFFMADPSGKSLGFSQDYIKSSPFADYFWPGWILFIAIGIYGLTCFLLVTFKYRYYPYHLQMQGIILVVWIAIQIIMVRDFNVLHVICIVIGSVLFAAGKSIGR